MNVNDVLSSDELTHDYMVRVVLHEPHNASSDYEELHTQMAAKAYVKTLTQKNVELTLPDAVYLKNALPGNAEAFAKEVCEIAKKASGDKAPEVVVAEAVKVVSLNLVSADVAESASVPSLANRYLSKIQ